MGKTLSITALAVGVLVALTLPKLQGRRRATELFRCQENLEKLGSAMRYYHDIHGSFPPVAHYNAAGTPVLSWRVLLLPYIGHQDLFREFNMDEPWDSAHNRTLLNRMPQIFHCPFDPDVEPTMSSYVAVSGVQTMFPSAKCVRRQDVSDGESLTIMLTEVGGSSIQWTKPEDLTFDIALRLQDIPTPRARGARHVLFVDGTVATIVNEVKRSTWQALLTRNGGEAISDSGF